MRKTLFQTGPAHPRWNGGVRTSLGYRFLHIPGHPRADYMGYVQEHLIVAERALGRFLSALHPVHHVNERRGDNSNDNLVICDSRAYHKLIHARMRALAACGQANFKRCPFCKKYDDPLLMKRRRPGREQHEHPECRRIDREKRRLKIKEVSWTS